MKWLKAVAVAALLASGAIIAALSQNTDAVQLRFAIWETPQALPVFWWMLASFVVGIFCGWLVLLWASAKRRMEMRRLRADLKQAEAEVARLRDVTLEG